MVAIELQSWPSSQQMIELESSKLMHVEDEEQQKESGKLEFSHCL